MEGFLRSYPIHAVQGLRGDAEQMEAVMAGFGYEPAERIDYDLMALDRHPLPVPGEFPPGLVLRPPREEDGDGLFALQAAYEREEVLPRGAVFDPAVCRLSLDRILKRERVLVAELDSRLVGKINTSALSFSRCQIGGVYVHPAFRGRGIARRMAAVFVQDLFSGGPSLSLFVKKRNTAARAVYLRTGFETIGDYRITYY
jgi:ribosomal protein S18 acetylase RimI-like enzyme